MSIGNHGDLYDTDDCAIEGILPDTYLAACPAVLSNRALTVHAERHERELKRLASRVAAAETALDRIANYMQGIGARLELEKAS